MFLGIDLTSSAARPSACALLDQDGALVHLAALRKDAEILKLVRQREPSIVAIDSPLGFPKGMCCLEEECGCRPVHEFKGRACERELARRGIGLYFTTKRSIIKKMVYRAMGLKKSIEASGRQVLEAYPYGSKVCLFGRPLPKKTRLEGLRFLQEHLGRLVAGLDQYPGRLDHDLCDALVAAYTAYLHSQGKTESVGLPEEACIILPKVPAAIRSQQDRRLQRLNSG